MGLYIYIVLMMAGVRSDRDMVVNTQFVAGTHATCPAYQHPISQGKTAGFPLGSCPGNRGGRIVALERLGGSCIAATSGRNEASATASRYRRRVLGDVQRPQPFDSIPSKSIRQRPRFEASHRVEVLSPQPM